MSDDLENIEEFNIFSWSKNIPLNDDLWLGMQFRNIAIVDCNIIRDMERQAIQEYIDREKTPSDILIVLSALSQMWIFNLYECLRTWRQRAKEIVDNHQKLSNIDAMDRENTIQSIKEGIEKRAELASRTVVFAKEHLMRFDDDSFVSDIVDYRKKTEGLFRSVEALRVTIAKHEIPKTNKHFAASPGYGRMHMLTGSIYWSVFFKDGSMEQISRREIANRFFGIEEYWEKPEYFVGFDDDDT